jgi:hypothetical protein
MTTNEFFGQGDFIYTNLLNSLLTHIHRQENRTNANKVWDLVEASILPYENGVEEIYNEYKLFKN